MQNKDGPAPSWLIILEAGAMTEVSESLRRGIEQAARRENRDVQVAELRREDISPCSGCFHCVTRHPGTCVHGSAFRGLTEMTTGCELVFFLTPVRFGTFSSTIKNVIDRGGLIIKSHQSCTQVILGYGTDATDEEIGTFIDITARHRGKADVVHPRSHESFRVHFARTLEEGNDILRAMEAAQ